MAQMMRQQTNKFVAAESRNFIAQCAQYGLDPNAVAQFIDTHRIPEREVYWVLDHIHNPNYVNPFRI